jgi:hypothetical protein
VAKLQDQCQSLRCIVYSRNYVEEEKDEHPNAFGNLRVLSVDACIELGPLSLSLSLSATTTTTTT